MRSRQVSGKVCTLIGLVGLLAAVHVSFAGPPASLTTLEPGAFRDIHQNLQINVVFVGYEQGAGAQQIDQAAMQAELPTTYRTFSRLPIFYGIFDDLGVSFTYNYNFVYADPVFEDKFFGYLSTIAEPRPRTVFQDAYNAQVAGTLDVGANHWIDAPSVEKWLANNAGAMLGVNTTQYTVFFINWHGRLDFKFHVYTKTDEPDVDTRVNHGLLRDTRKIIAWGGTTPDDEESGLGSLRRIWFYDLSAGPEAWTNNWNVDHADLDGDGVLDYRMPPVWEYGNLSGYRPFDDLSGDLGKVLRYVAVDLLFTTSPHYKPAISPPKLPADIQIDVNVFQGDPSVDGRNQLNPGLINREVGELRPLDVFTTEVSERPLEDRASETYDCFIRSLFPPFFGMSCYGNRLFDDGFFDIYLYNTDHLMLLVEGDGEYEIPVVMYNTTDGRASPFSGFQDDNKTDGTQSFAFIFTYPALRRAGFGPTDTITHEVGHHLGLSHPHDGSDYETGNFAFSPFDGPFYFVWSGDESNSVMSYLSVNYDFSQFDRDNMDRYMTAIYINHSNAILRRILRSPRAGEVSGLIATADGQASVALGSYSAMNYAGAAASAKAAYQGVLNAAAQINIQIEPQTTRADYRSNGRSLKFVDAVQGLRVNEP